MEFPRIRDLCVHKSKCWTPWWCDLLFACRFFLFCPLSHWIKSAEFELWCLLLFLPLVFGLFQDLSNQSVASLELFLLFFLTDTDFQVLAFLKSWCDVPVPLSGGSSTSAVWGVCVLSRVECGCKSHCLWLHTLQSRWSLLMLHGAWLRPICMVHAASLPQEHITPVSSKCWWSDGFVSVKT